MTVSSFATQIALRFPGDMCLPAQKAKTNQGIGNFFVKKAMGVLHSLSSTASGKVGVMLSDVSSDLQGNLTVFPGLLLTPDLFLAPLAGHHYSDSAWPVWVPLQHHSYSHQAITDLLRASPAL
eukprot:gene1407-2766_t